MRLLTGPEKGTLRKAILDHYTVFTFQSFTDVRLDKAFFNFVPPVAPFDFQVLEFINRMNAQGEHGGLISAFLAEHPDHDAVLKLAFDLGIGAGLYAQTETQKVDAGALQNIVNNFPFLDVSVLLRQIARIERCVCRMEIRLAGDKMKWGTGFLVGPDLVMTNYHVLRELILQPDTVQEVICRFDYNITAEGDDIFQGRPVGLAPNAVLAYSPYSDFDLDMTAGLNVAWPAGHLDYALVRLEQAISDEPFGPYLKGELPASEAARGYIRPPAVAPVFTDGGHLFIVQHPNKGPKKIAFGFGMVIGADLDQQRVRYAVNTLKGSSGSPCFNEKYEWTALHNAGDPDWNPQFNQGIPVTRIVEDLENKGITLN